MTFLFHEHWGFPEVITLYLRGDEPQVGKFLFPWGLCSWWWLSSLRVTLFSFQSYPSVHVLDALSLFLISSFVQHFSHSDVLRTKWVNVCLKPGPDLPRVLLGPVHWPLCGAKPCWFAFPTCQAVLQLAYLWSSATVFIVVSLQHLRLYLQISVLWREMPVKKKRIFWFCYLIIKSYR